MKICTRIVGLVGFMLLAATLTACASKPVPEVSAEDAASGGEGERNRGQMVMAIFELIPGVNFFLIPMEQALTGTTGLTEFWHETCNQAAGQFVAETGDCIIGWPGDE